MNLQQRHTNFAQPNWKSRTLLSKDTVFVIAGQFSRGNEIREQEFYYETIALLILVNKGCVKVRHVNTEVQRSVKHCLVSTEYFLFLIYFDGHQNGEQFYQRGAILRGATAVWGGSCHKLPPWIRHCWSK